MGNGDFIVVESINSNIRRAVVNSIYEENSNKYFIIKKKDIMCTDIAIAEAQRQLSGLMWPHNDNEIGEKLPFQYWLHLQVCWYSLRTKFDISPFLAENKSIIMDGWYYSFFAKSMISGINESYLIETFKDVAIADYVVLVEITDFEQLWRDNDEKKPSKFGVHQGYTDKTKEIFIKYHMDLQNKLLEIAKDNHWLIVAQDDLNSKQFGF